MTSRAITRAVSRRVAIDLPPSKSYTQRALVAAALAGGESIIRNPSRSDDTQIMVAALGRFGIPVVDEGKILRVRGCGGKIPPGDRSIDVGNAGTCMRFLTALATLAPGATTLTGDAAMLGRPVLGLVRALRDAGADVSSAGRFPPVTIRGGGLAGGSVALDAAPSSQFLSALLLVGPYAGRGLEITLDGRPSSAPYISMTLDVMKRFGVGADRTGGSYVVPAGKAYSPCDYPVESDLSAATVFGAAAAITGCVVELRGIPAGTLQGDIGFFTLLREMGCGVEERENALEVSAGRLRGVTVDMNPIPDSVPALAVTAAFAATPTAVTGVPHLRHKETDRLAALASELKAIGARAEATPDGLNITPRPLHGAEIETYNDHRIAMSFAVAGLALDGMRIRNPECVGKSFPGFWTEIEKFT